jgi:hypothetical protein
MTAFLSRIPPPANDVGQHRPGGEPKRRSAVPSPLPPNCNDVQVPLFFGIAPPMATAVVGGCHRSLVILLLLLTVAVIFLILLLPPKRTPFPDPGTLPRRATCKCRSQTVKIVQGGQHTMTMVAWHQSTRASSHHRWPGGEDNLRQSIPFLKVANMCWKWQALVELSTTLLSARCPMVRLVLLIRRGFGKGAR